MDALKSMACMVNCKKVGMAGCAVRDKSVKLDRNYFANNLQWPGG